MTSAVAFAQEDLYFVSFRFAHGVLARSLAEFKELRGVLFVLLPSGAVVKDYLTAVFSCRCLYAQGFIVV